MHIKHEENKLETKNIQQQKNREIFAQMEIEVISYLIGNPSYQKLKVKMVSYFDLYNTDSINLATILYSLNRRLSRLSLYVFVF